MLQQYLPFTVLKRDIIPPKSFFEILRLQQYLPFTVLKLSYVKLYFFCIVIISCNSTYRLRYWNNNSGGFSNGSLDVATVLTVYGIETFRKSLTDTLNVATVLTVYGIETINSSDKNLQKSLSCNSTYRLRYWNLGSVSLSLSNVIGCNSTYRLRYWNW